MSRRISVVLDLESGRFTASMKDAAAATSGLDKNLDATQATVKRIENRMKGLVATTRDLTVILGQARTALYNLRIVATGWLESIIKTNAEMERMTFLLANMSDKMTIEERFRDAGDSLDYLFGKAKEAPFSLGAITDSFVKMKTTGIDPTKGGLDGLTNAVAAFGGNDQILHRASIAIQQMSGKGVISMEELRQQLGEAVPSAINLMARSMDMTMGELVDKISKGQVESASALNKMFGEFNRAFGGSAQAMMDTFSGKVSVAKTALVEFAMAVGGFDQEAGRFADGSLMATINEQIQRFIDLMGTTEVALFAKNMADGLVSAFQAASKLVNILVQYKDVVIAAGKAFLLYFGARAVIGSIVALTGSFRGLVASVALFKTRLGEMNMIMALTNGTMVQKTAAMGTMGAVAQTTASRLVLLGRAFSVMLGPIGLVITAVLTLAMTMGAFEDKAKKAAKAAEDFQAGFATADGLKDIEAGIKDIQGKIADLNKEMEYTSRFTNPSSGMFKVHQKNLQAVAAYYDELATLEAARLEGIALIREQAAEQAANRMMRQLNKETSAIRAEYVKQQNELDAQRTEIANRTDIDEKQREALRQQLREQRLALVKESYQKELEAAEKFNKGLLEQKARILAIEAALPDVFRAVISGMPNTEIDKLNLLLEQTGEKIRAIYDQLDREMNIATSDPVIIGTKNDDSKYKADPVGDRLQAMRIRAAELNAELAGTSGELAKIQAQMEEWAKKGETITPQQRKEFEELAASIEKAGDKIKENAKNAQLQQRIADQLERQTESANELMQVLNGGYSEIDAEAAIFKIRLDQIVAKMTEGKEEAAELVDETVDAFRRGQAADYLLGLKRQTQEITDSLLEGNDRAQAAYDRDVARIYEIVDLTKFSGEERMRMEAIVSDYIRARRDQLARETETGFQRMLREWQKTTEAMDQAQQGWLDNFVNSLVDGEFRFKDFAKAILADIAKIIIRAQIANAIMSVMGSFGGGGGGSGGAGGTAASGISSVSKTLGSIRAPVNHSGAIVGQTVNPTRAVSAAIFAAAKRYHNGGLIGLKPDERPAILQTGERVLNRAETRDYGRIGSGPNVQVNIINEGGQEMQEKSRNTRFDGESYIIDIVCAAAGQPGKMRTAIKDAAKN